MKAEDIHVTLSLNWESYQTIQDALDIAHKSMNLPPEVETRYQTLFNHFHEDTRRQIWAAIERKVVSETH